MPFTAFCLHVASSFSTEKIKKYFWEEQKNKKKLEMKNAIKLKVSHTVLGGGM